MIYPETMVALPGPRLVVPERPYPATRIEGVDRVGPAVVENSAIGVARSRLRQRVVLHRANRKCILVLGNDVEIAHDDRGLLAIEHLHQPRTKPLHPGDLVVEL